MTNLPAVAAPVDAIAAGAPTVHDDVAGNICYDCHIGDKIGGRACSHKAGERWSRSTTQNLPRADAIGPRAASVIFDTSSGDYTRYNNNHQARTARYPPLLMSAFRAHCRRTSCAGRARMSAAASFHDHPIRRGDVTWARGRWPPG